MNPGKSNVYYISLINNNNNKEVAIGRDRGNREGKNGRKDRKMDREKKIRNFAFANTLRKLGCSINFL